MQNSDKSLTNKYRPSTLKDFRNNPAIVESLSTIFERKDSIPHAFLFTGGTGIGKTTIARIIKNTLDVHDQCYFEVNTGSDRGIEKVREIINQSRYAPIIGNWKIYFLDECSQLSSDAQSALLKILEEPPKHVIFILATTDPSKLRKDLRDRCTKFVLRQFSNTEMLSYLKDVVYKEGFDEFPESILKAIVSAAEGSARHALSLLDSVIDVEDTQQCLQMIEEISGTSSIAESKGVADLCKALMKGESWKSISPILKQVIEEKSNIESIRLNVLAYLGAVFMNSGNKHVLKLMNLFSQSWVGPDAKQMLIIACGIASGNT